MTAQHRFAGLILAALVLTACGGGSGAPSSTCSLSNQLGCGGSAQPDAGTPTPPSPTATAAAINLVASRAELPSSGAPGSEVTITALVRTAQNTALTDAPITFTADSGFILATGLSTDPTGKASATLSTGGSRLNRVITVTATAGKIVATQKISVVGTSITLAGPTSTTMGSSLDLVATLVDSAGQPIVGEAVSASTKNGNGATLSNPTTDSRGQVIVHLAASARGDEQLTASALGATAAKALNIIGPSEVVLLPEVASGSGGVEVLKEVPIGACYPVDGHYAAAGPAAQVLLTASRGQLFRDAACTQPQTTAVALAAGQFPRSYIKSANTGITTIEAAIVGGPRAITRLEFVAPLGAGATVTLQAEQAVLGSGETTGLIAVVRDGTPARNLVKNALVQFSVLSDPSNGSLQLPFNVLTGSDGSARAVFAAGSADGGKDATHIQARIADMPASTTAVALTIDHKALSIQFGTGNVLVQYSSTVLQQDYAVFVSDAAGNPVRDVQISAAAWPVRFLKGGYYWEPYNPPARVPGHWTVDEAHLVACPNEDLTRRGLFETAFDLNGNGRLEPGMPLTVIVSGKTDAQGLATVSVRYPRDRGNWLDVELTVTGTVSGTESMARSTFRLPVVGSDFNDFNVVPPGFTSPYGKLLNCNSPD